MRGLLRVLRIIIYFGTIIPPVIDALKGVVEGIKKGREDVLAEQKMVEEQKYRQDKEQIMRGQK